MRNLRNLKIEIFEISYPLNFNKTQIMTKTYENLNSSAINSVIIEDNVVKVVYQSNIDKVYEFNCENVEEFEQNLSEQLIGVELQQSEVSVGRFINQQIKDKVLVESK